MVTTPVEGKSSLHSKASSSRSPRLSLQGYNRYLILWIAPLYNGLLILGCRSKFLYETYPAPRASPGVQPPLGGGQATSSLQLMFQIGLHLDDLPLLLALKNKLQCGYDKSQGG